MKKHLLMIAALALCGAASAKLPPLSAEAKAKADEAAARTAWQGKVDAYKLCQAQDRVAARYRASVPAGRPAPGEVVGTPACTDPGPFVYTPPQAKPIEQAGAHSPAATAARPRPRGRPRRHLPPRPPAPRRLPSPDWSRGSAHSLH